MDILVIYQFCTFGGVERVMLNRAQAFKQNGLEVKITIGYMYDRGALLSFKNYLKEKRLDDRVFPVILPDFFSYDLNKHDTIFVIDTPQVFESISAARNLYVECHTPYKQSRQYLRELPNSVKGIIVPSNSFKALLNSEFSGLPEIFVLPNLVSDEFFEISPLKTESFTKRPLTYFARVEDLKNFIEALRIFELMSERDDVMFWIIGEGAAEKALIQSLERKRLLDKCLLRDRIDFSKVPYLVNLVKKHRGIFISPSKGESFGLSAAEFISGGVPALLSDIPPHKELVEEDGRFLYPLGDVFTAREKLVNLLDDWTHAAGVVESYGRKFRSEVFIQEWKKLVEQVLTC